MRNVQLIFNPLKFLRWFKNQDMFSLYVTNDIKQNQIEANLKLTEKLQRSNNKLKINKDSYTVIDITRKLKENFGGKF